MAAARTFSLIEASGILDVSRQTLAKWLHDGCPAVKKADRAAGADWELSIAQIMQWRVDRAVAATVERFEGKDAALISIDEAKRRKAVADMVMAEIEAEEALGGVAQIADMVGIVTTKFGELRSRLVSFCAKLAARAATMTNPAEIREMAEAEMRKALDVLTLDPPAR